MKKELKTMMTTLMMCLTVTTINFAQKDSVYVVKEVDAMSEETFIYPNRRFSVANKEKSIGFVVDAYIDESLNFKMITTTMAGIGNCNENDVIIILFDSGDKITTKSWKKFNCDGDAYFNVNEQDLEMLRTQTIDKIRITNGRTFESYTGDVATKDKRYFIQLIYALDNKLTTLK